MQVFVTKVKLFCLKVRQPNQRVVCTEEGGKLEQQRRRWLRKRHLKSEFTLPQNLSRLFHLV